MKNREITEEEFSIIIEKLMDIAWLEYDDAVKQSNLTLNNVHKAEYIEIAKDALTTIEKLIEQIPGKESPINIYVEKAQ